MSLDTWRATLTLVAYSFWRIPLIAWCRPRVMEVSDNRLVVRIPLRHRTRNHLNSMYFGVLAVGADCAGGFLAMQAIKAEKRPIALVFKDFHADFVKRPEGDVDFVCEQGAEIRELVAKTVATGERQNLPLHVTAEVGGEVVARFVLTLSLKVRPA